MRISLFEAMVVIEVMNLFIKEDGVRKYLNPKK